MCGICGYIALGNQECPAEGTLKSMTDHLVHRGPDADGYHLEEGLALANRRLSIVDVEGGQQPIFNEDGTVCVVFNGEIYNQADLRRELELQGHIFSTKADTEVLVHIYEEHGEGGIQLLNGMFTFALWDRQRRRALIVRDRLGIKPLYYGVVGEVLVFGSEIKALLAFPGMDRELDIEGLDSYLGLRYLPGEQTIFSGIRKLLPGHLLRLDTHAGLMEIAQYWKPELAVQHSVNDEKQIAEELFDLLQDAVRIRLMSDVPFGAFLSGGLDSSGVVALMSRVMDEPVKTFSIGFSEEARLDERRHARSVSQHCATQHREVDCTADKVEILPKLISHFDEPFADPIIVPTYQVAELAAEHVKVVLTGEGADEVFGGYTRFVSDRHMRRFRRWPAWVRRGAGIAGGMIPLTGVRHQAARAMEMAEMSDGERFLEWVTAFSTAERSGLYVPEMRGEGENRAADLYERYNAEFPEASSTDRMLYCDMKIRLSECMLARTDRMTMAVSLEGRTPFLDHRVVEWMMRLPGYFKVRGNREKYLLKRALSRILPGSIIQRRKQGLAVPFAQWTRFGIETHIRRILRRERVKKRGFFEPDYVQDLLGHWGPHAARHSQLIWSLLCLELWCQIYLDDELDPETPLSQVD
jgi:asparagine synthase (glutamine-hydrolysing)